MKKRRNLGMKMMMAPGKKPSATNNPIILLSKFPGLAETSIVDQNSTIFTVENKHVTLLKDFQAIGSQFTLVVNVLIYDPKSELSPMAVLDTVTDNSGIPHSRIYHQAFQVGFGKDDNAYQHAMFFLSNVAPIENNLTITVKHSMCKRRVVTVEQFANLDSDPLDRQVLKQSTDPGEVQITSGLTGATTTPFELIYGSIAIGRDFDQFSEPQEFVPIQSIGSSIDSFDATLKTYYKLSAIQDRFGLSALVSNSEKNNFVWSAAVQTFKSIQL